VQHVSCVVPRISRPPPGNFICAVCRKQLLDERRFTSPRVADQQAFLKEYTNSFVVGRKHAAMRAAAEIAQAALAASSVGQVSR